MVTLDVTMDPARIEDVLTLALKAATPPMTGALRLTTKFVLPRGGDREVIERLRLDGQFAIADTRFTDPAVQKKINELSRRSQGKIADQDAQQRGLAVQRDVQVGWRDADDPNESPSTYRALLCV